MAHDDFMLRIIPTDFNVELIWNDGPEALFAEVDPNPGQSHLLDRREVSQRIITRQASGDSRRRVAPRQGGRTCGNDCATLDSFAF